MNYYNKAYHHCYHQPLQNHHNQYLATPAGHTEYHKNPLVKRSLNKDLKRVQNRTQRATTQPTHHTLLTQSPKSPYHSHNQTTHLLHRTPQNHLGSLSHRHQTLFHNHPQCQPSTPPQGELVALEEHPRTEED